METKRYFAVERRVNHGDLCSAWFKVDWMSSLHAARNLIDKKKRQFEYDIEQNGPVNHTLEYRIIEYIGTVIE